MEIWLAHVVSKSKDTRIRSRMGEMDLAWVEHGPAFFRLTTTQTYQFLTETVAALNEHLEPEKKLSDLEKNLKFF